MTIKQKTFSAVRWTSLAMLGKAGLQLLQVTVLARILAPADFGLMAMVVAVIAFAQIFSDMGVSNAIIHHQKISEESLSSLYWLNVLVGFLLMLMLIAISPLVAHWYHEPRMQAILQLMSLTFLLGAIGQQLRVLAEKKLRFQKLAIIELSCASLGFAVSVLVALGGGGIYALVAGMLCSVLATTLMYWLLLAEGWRPMWRLRLGEIREYLGFGAYMLGFSLTNTVSLQADILIGGRMLGTTSLGAYSLSKDLSLRLAMIINPIVTRVGLPVMAQAQEDAALLKSIYLKTLLMTASINFPLYLFGAVFAHEVISVVFGSQWEPAAPLLRILALWGLVRSIGNPAGSLVFAMGRSKLAFWWSMGLMLAMVPAYWFGAQFGADGLALAALLAMLAMPVPQWMILVRPLCGAGFVEYFMQLTTPFLIACFSVSLGYAAALPFSANLARLCGGLLIGGLVYLILSRWLNRVWFAAMSELLFGRKPINVTWNACMKISVFNFTFYLVVGFAVLSPLLSAHAGGDWNFLYKIYALALLIAATFCVFCYRGRFINKLLFNPATYFLYYLIIQSVIVMVTAGSNFKIYVFQLSALLLPSLAVLIVASMSLSKGKTQYWILNVIIYIAVASLLIDAAGYGEIFKGHYGAITTERFGFQQLHGFMPWQNAMATMLVIFGVLLHINKADSGAHKIGYLATFGTVTRAYVLSAILLFILSLRSTKQKLVFLTIGLLTLVLTFGVVKDSTSELIDPDTVYRIQYVRGSFEVLIDYPLLGVGLGRLSDASVWRHDRNFFQVTYGLPSDLSFSWEDSVDMGTSDTGLTLIGEIGGIGLILFLFQLVWFVQLSIKNDKNFLLVLIPMFIALYSTPGILFSYTFGIFYWLLFGQLIAKNYRISQPPLGHSTI